MTRNKLCGTAAEAARAQSRKDSPPRATWRAGRWLAVAGFVVLLGTAVLQSPDPVHAQHVQHASHAQTGQSQYAGQQQREITTLSTEDLSALRQGQGWGLARPAELNGVPGPAHLLELAHEIGLSSSQRDAIERMFIRMRDEAIELGSAYVEAERAIDAYFKAGEFSDERLRVLVQNSADALARLRFLHLSYHDQTLKVITDDQVVKYNQLRGYTPSAPHESTRPDPCASVPPGHDPAMYRKHMGCP